MSDDIWRTLIEAAKTQAPCASDECLVETVVGPLYAILTHVGVYDHACEVCTPGTLMQLLVSIESLQTMKRHALVERVSRWLRHAHLTQDAPDSGRVGAVDVVGAGGERGRLIATDAGAPADVAPSDVATAADIRLTSDGSDGVFTGGC